MPGIGPVDRDEIVKGYEVEKGHYVLLDPEEIESVKLESRKTLDLVQFVDEKDIDATYFDKPYYFVPADDLAEEAYVVLRDALKAASKVGVGQLAMRGQEYVVALKPCGRGHPARNPALCGRSPQIVWFLSRHRRSQARSPTCSTWPRC